MNVVIAVAVYISPNGMFENRLGLTCVVDQLAI